MGIITLTWSQHNTEDHKPAHLFGLNGIFLIRPLTIFRVEELRFRITLFENGEERKVRIIGGIEGLKKELNNKGKRFKIEMIMYCYLILV